MPKTPTPSLPEGYAITTNENGIRFVRTPHGSLVPNQGSRKNPGETETDEEIISDFMLWFAKQPKREATHVDFLALAAKHKIELRGIQYAAFASDETNCFSANIYIDGKKVGDVSNDGHGGCDMFHPHAVEEKLDAIARTLPPTICEWIDPKTGKPGVMQQSAEDLVGALFEQWQRAKESEKGEKKLRKDLTQKLLWTEKGKKGIWASKKLTPEQIVKYAANPPAKWNVDVMLNALPFPEAKKIYDANIDVVYR